MARGATSGTTDVSRADEAATAGVVVAGTLVLVALASYGPTAPAPVVLLRPVAAGVVLAAAGAHGAVLGRDVRRPLLLLALGWLLALAAHQLLVADSALGDAADVLAAAALVAPLLGDLRAATADLWVVAVVAWGWALGAALALGHDLLRRELALDGAETTWLRRGTTGCLIVASAVVPPALPFVVGRLVAEERGLLRSWRRAPIAAGVLLVTATSVALSLEERVVPDLDRWLEDGFVAPAAALVGASLVALALLAGPAWAELAWVRRARRPAGAVIVAHWLAAAIVLDRLEVGGWPAHAEVAVTLTVVVALALAALDPRPATSATPEGAEERLPRPLDDADPRPAAEREGAAR